MDDDDDKLLVVAKESPATDKLSRVLNWLGLVDRIRHHRLGCRVRARLVAKRQRSPTFGPFQH